MYARYRGEDLSSITDVDRDRKVPSTSSDHRRLEARFVQVGEG